MTNWSSQDGHEGGTSVYTGDLLEQIKVAVMALACVIRVHFYTNTQHNADVPAQKSDLFSPNETLALHFKYTVYQSPLNKIKGIILFT